MSARSVGKSVVMAIVGTLSGATAVLAGTGTIHRTASPERTTDYNLADALGALGEPAGTPAPSQSPAPDANATGTDQSGNTTNGADTGTAQPGAATPSPSRTRVITATPTPTHTHGASGHFTGEVSWSNPYGPVQVRINVSNGKITDSSLVQMPQDFTSQRISTQAAVYLREEVLAAQSASISWIGGASLTSPAYIESLSSAIAKAGI